jgi:hypothetical protein
MNTIFETGRKERRKSYPFFLRATPGNPRDEYADK